VIDADGLNHLAGASTVLQNRPADTVLTPHPGEMARLLGTTAPAVQRDRIGCARDLATALSLHVVLKGARTVIAHPDGTVYINPTGNSGMASGGMGDVLTGALAGLIAQGIRPDRAARAAAYLHGAAADHLAISVGPWGYLAGEVMNALPRQLAVLFTET
jgi:NAD(P)H-hydrate epimerase